MMGIGAAPFSTTAAFNDRDFGGACLPACAEPFSSAGGVEIRIDIDGKRLSAPDNRFKPDVTGPDGSNTSFFVTDSIIDDDDGDGLLSPAFDGENPADEFPNFFGTSASAPHVAALAALMLDASEFGPMQANDGSKQRICLLDNVTLLLDKDVADHLLNKSRGPRIARKGFCLTPGEVELAMEATALDMTRRVVDRLSGTFIDIANSEGFDFDTGAGFVDGVSAVKAVATPPIKLILKRK
jgi:subtilisin family serine protease